MSQEVAAQPRDVTYQWFQEDRGAHWNDAAASQGTSRIPGTPEVKRDDGTDAPSESPEATNPADTLTLDVWSPELGEEMSVVLIYPLYSILLWQL